MPESYGSNRVAILLWGYLALQRIIEKNNRKQVKKEHDIDPVQTEYFGISTTMTRDLLTKCPEIIW